MERTMKLCSRDIRDIPPDWERRHAKADRALGGKISVESIDTRSIPVDKLMEARYNCARMVKIHRSVILVRNYHSDLNNIFAKCANKLLAQLVILQSCSVST